ncbi:hypothetical protein Hanom_Chr02g00107461 [Helianthus anomalus]
MINVICGVSVVVNTASKDKTQLIKMTNINHRKRRRVEEESLNNEDMRYEFKGEFHTKLDDVKGIELANGGGSAGECRRELREGPRGCIWMFLDKVEKRERREGNPRKDTKQRLIYTL